MTLRKFIDDIAAKVNHLFDESGQVVPIWHMIDGNGDILVMPMMSEDKDLSITIAKAMMKVAGVERYAFIDEGWVATASKIPARGAVRNMPGRKEVVMIMAEDIAEGNMIAYCEIIRSSGCKPRLGPMQYLDGPNEGRFLGLLPIKKLHS